MNRALFPLGLSVLVFTLFLPSICPAQNDSLADCFPLSIGNRWLYHYYHTVPGAPFRLMSDTGIINYSILGKTDFPDSTVWAFEERRNFHRIFYSEGHATSDSLIIDSTLFNFVEIKSGRHEIYRRHSDLDPADIYKGLLWNSAIPFLSD